PKNTIPIGYEQNISTGELYILAEMDTENELAPTLLDSTLKHCINTTRYDAQFAKIEDLRG
ncbi:MAG: hypothetical protein IJ150_11710, partial [Bacteroidales bacterium]|nr:hypothetical protein [Bacteroidales bacterium]